MQIAYSFKPAQLEFNFLGNYDVRAKLAGADITMNAFEQFAVKLGLDAFHKHLRIRFDQIVVIILSSRFQQRSQFVSLVLAKYYYGQRSARDTDVEVAVFLLGGGILARRQFAVSQHCPTMHAAPRLGTK